jgi:hypothetical protein
MNEINQRPEHFPFWLARLMIGVALAPLAHGAQSAPARSEAIVWRLEDPKRVGGQVTTVLGSPRATAEEGRNVLYFNGTSDGLIVPRNPIQGLAAFTIEVRFKPDANGSEAQRFVHLEDVNQNRALIETRVTSDKQWYLDTFLYSHPTEKGVTLVDKAKLHPCDRWYWAALVYDGKVMSHFVDAVVEQQGEIAFGPMGEGRTSIGVRLNQVFWYKGAIAEVRFHPHAVAVGKLQRSR